MSINLISYVHCWGLIAKSSKWIGESIGQGSDILYCKVEEKVDENVWCCAIIHLLDHCDAIVFECISLNET